MNCSGCGGELSGRQKKWCSPECQKDAARAARLKAHFDLTPEDYETILKFQGGVCAMCDKPPKPGKRLAVDHDHRTGIVRGLVCYLDNRVVLGARTPERLIRAAAYVTDPPARRALGRDVVAPGRPPGKRRKRRRRAAPR